MAEILAATVAVGNRHRRAYTTSIRMHGDMFIWMGRLVMHPRQWDRNSVPVVAIAAAVEIQTLRQWDLVLVVVAVPTLEIQIRGAVMQARRWTITFPRITIPTATLTAVLRL